MSKSVSVSRGSWTLVSSALAGPPAHHEQLQQLLDAPDPYWKAQTPVGFRPVARATMDSAKRGFQEFAVSNQAGLGEVITLCVLMAARMPGLSIDLRVSPPAALAVNAPSDVSGVRLVRGKLEIGRALGGELQWTPPPHHSSLIGKK